MTEQRWGRLRRQLRLGLWAAGLALGLLVWWVPRGAIVLYLALVLGWLLTWGLSTTEEEDEDG